MTFNQGIPDFDSVIIVEQIGPCQLKHFYENGDVLIYMGSNRTFKISGAHHWRYAA